MYSNKKFVNHNDENAQIYYKSALTGFLKLESKNQSDDNLLYKIGVMYMNGFGTEKNLNLAEQYLETAADKHDNALAKYALGKLYLTDEFRNLVLAEYYLTEAADKNNNHFAQYTLGKHYLEYYKDSETAKKYFFRSAEQNNEFAQYALGKLYLSEDKQYITAGRNIHLAAQIRKLCHLTKLIKHKFNFPGKLPIRASSCVSCKE